MSGPATRLLHLGLLELHSTADNSSTRLIVETFGPAELARDEIEQLADAVLEHLEQTRISTDELHEREWHTGEVERERDEALERIKALEALTERQRREIEQHKTAGEIADRRARGLERDVERMRAAGQPYEPPSIKVHR